MKPTHVPAGPALEHALEVAYIHECSPVFTAARGVTSDVWIPCPCDLCAAARRWFPARFRRRTVRDP